MLDIPIGEGNSDSQDLNRTIETLCRRDGLSLAEAMETVVPPIVAEIVALPEDLHSFYMYMRQLMGPFAQGPVALIARHDDECVFSADALGLRPLWQLETADDFVFSSEPGVVSIADLVSEPKPMAPGEKFMVTIDRDEAHLDPLSARGDAARGEGALAAAHRRRGDGLLQGRAQGGRPARGPRGPGLHRGRARRSGRGPRTHPRRLRLAARRREAGPADGLERRRADRLARLRRAAGGALARAPEPRRLLQGDGRGRHQPGDRPRARDRALLHPGDLRSPPELRRPGQPQRHRRHRHPGAARRPPRDGAPGRQRLPQDRRRSRHLPARGPLGGVPRPRWRWPRRPREGDRHRPARVRDDPGCDRAAEARGGEGGQRRHRAAGADRPRRLRGRPALDRSASRHLGRRPGAEVLSGRARTR